MRFLLILLVICLSVGGAYWYWTTTPQYSIEQVKVAVKAHDLPKFREYFDVDSVSDRMVDDFLSPPMQQLGPHNSLLAGIVQGLVDGLVKPTLTPVVKEEVEQFVIGGKFSHSQTDASLPAGRPTLATFDKKFGFRNHAFRSIKYVKIDGDSAITGLVFHNEVYQADLLLELKMRKVENHWQVMQLTNFPDFVANIAQLQLNRVPTATPPARK
ncbi:MAG: hypothetical protein P4L53_06365 [Candidatus Obscuribacterales bacterium]|nr:hypothetical protein [Candidatus Obscuribacterales bacterium]